MFFWKTRFRPVVSAVLLAFSLTAPAVAANVKGAETAAKPEAVPTINEGAAAEANLADSTKKAWQAFGGTLNPAEK